MSRVVTPIPRAAAPVVWLALAILSLCGCSVEKGECVWVNATVGEASYTPSHSMTGVGPAIGGKGGVAVTFSTIPASYVVTYYREDGGGKESVDSYEWWRGCRIGQHVELGYTRWRWKGRDDWHWSLDSLRTHIQ